MKRLGLFLALMFVFSFSFGQKKADTLKNHPPTGIKLGGILPAISYNTDVGFRYGALMNIYDWGNGSWYPDYVRSLYLEASKTTKGSGQLIVNYDDKAFLGSKVRLLANIGYYVEQALDFYGFNGYESVFHSDWMTNGTDTYKSRMFYRLDRRMLRMDINVQVPLAGQKLRFYGGIGYFPTRINSVDIARLNQGKPAAERLPSVDSVPGLYELYQRWGVIAPEEAHGGKIGMLKIGGIYDTRDNEPMPNRGVWDEIILISAVDFAHPAKYKYMELVLTHRQYFTLIPHHLIFAYRLSYSSILLGRAPFYMLPFYYSTKDDMQDGFGGNKTVRGVLRDRVQADGVAFGNFEMRWRVWNTKLFKQDFYIALSSFLDGIIVTKRHDFNLNFAIAPSSGYTEDMFFDFNKQDLHKPHLGIGGGIRFGLNENFIVAVDYGHALNPQDGNTGLYIGLNWLF